MRNTVEASPQPSSSHSHYFLKTNCQKGFWRGFVRFNKCFQKIREEQSHSAPTLMSAIRLHQQFFS